MPRFAVIHVWCKGEGRIGIGRIGQFAEDRLFAIAFIFAGDMGGVCFDPFRIGLGNHIAQGGFVEYLLEPYDVCIHRLQLLRQPIGFPSVFLGCVFLEFIVLLVSPNQVFDVETGNCKTCHIRLRNVKGRFEKEQRRRCHRR